MQTCISNTSRKWVNEKEKYRERERENINQSHFNMHSILSLAKYFASNYIFVLISWQCFRTNSERERNKQKCWSLTMPAIQDQFRTQFKEFFFCFSVKFIFFFVTYPIQFWYRILTTRTFSYSNKLSLSLGQTSFFVNFKETHMKFIN